MNQLEDKSLKMSLCGFYYYNLIGKSVPGEYYFNDKNDYFENWFIATKSNNPLVEKWQFVIKKFWDNRKNGLGILDE